MRQADDPLSLLAALEREPWAFDFLQAMRRLECVFPDKPRWGTALRPQDEALRLGQEPSLAFAPASLSALRPGKEGAPPRLQVRFFGLLGPNGPLPLHLTEYAFQRELQHGDETFARFLDLIHHRFLALFYRAWAQAQPTTSLDRPAQDRFATYVASLIGTGQPGLQRRDSVPDNARLFQAGLLGRQSRNAEGLHTALAAYFELPIEVEQYVGHWMTLRERDHTRLGRNRLGRDAVIGRRVWDRQSRFRLHIGPMSLAQYRAFLPGGSGLAQLVDWVRFYTGGELSWDARLSLRKEEVPPLQLGRGAQLGWTSWLGKRQGLGDASDLVLDAERLTQRHQADTGARESAPAPH